LMNTCRGSERNRTKAKDAAYNLLTLGEITYEAMEELHEELYLEELHQFRTKLLSERHSFYDLMHLRHKLQKLAHSNRSPSPQAVSILARTYHDLAQAFVKGKDLRDENFEEAQTTIELAQSIP